MPRKSNLPFSGESAPRIPKLRHHRPSGRAVVTLCDRDCYVGPWGTITARIEYDRLIRLWLANGRRLDDETADLRISELIDRYQTFADGYYKPCKKSGEAVAIARALRPLGEMFGRDRVADFGPLKLKTLRQRWIEDGRVRDQINAAVRRVVRCFRWAVENELASGEVLHALRAVPGLRAGRSEAKESPPVQAVDPSNVETALPFMSAQVRAMVQLQLLTGARPGEIVQMTAAMIERTEPCWLFRPTEHKSKHHGRARVVFLGPQSMALITPFLESRGPDVPLFSPKEVIQSIRADRTASRKTPLSFGNRAGTNRRQKPKRTPGNAYTVASYQLAIHRACRKAAKELKADVPTFGPHRLRHTYATEVRRLHGLEAAQVLLGHARADVTQIYAERDAKKAAAVAAQIG